MTGSSANFRQTMTQNEGLKKQKIPEPSDDLESDGKALHGVRGARKLVKRTKVLF